MFMFIKINDKVLFKFKIDKIIFYKTREGSFFLQIKYFNQLLNQTGKFRLSEVKRRN